MTTVREDLVKALEAVEWVDTPTEWPSTWSGEVCPWCAEYKEDGHTDECPVGAALNRARAEPECACARHEHQWECPCYQVGLDAQEKP